MWDGGGGGEWGMKFGSVDIALGRIGRINLIKLASESPVTTISLPTV